MILPSYDFSRRGIDKNPRLADWGFNVTICIGALCENRDKIVLISDSKVSFGDFSADMAVLKMDVLFSRWITLFAGEDTEHIPFILERTHSLLSALRRRKVAIPTPAQVANALQRAYQERLDEQIEATVLRRYGFTVSSFNRDGKKRCTASVYNGLCSKIANVKLSLKFLLAGFDAKNKGYLLVGGGEEAPTDYSKLGFWAIGTGADSALSSLTYHRQRQHISSSVSVEQCLYVTCASKFMSESARDVGRWTSGCVIGPPPAGFDTLLSHHPIRKIWEEEGAPRLPKNLEARMKPLIVTPERAGEVAQEALDYFKRLDSQTSEGPQ
jgi:ATP-dependent protease HslVU (ClpYQ) peptidase subunit